MSSPKPSSPMLKKKKKEPSAYAKWIASSYSSVRHLPLRDRFRELGRRWQAKKKKASAPAPEPEPARVKKKKRTRKKAK